MQAIAVNQGLSIGQTGMSGAAAQAAAAGQGGDFMQLILQMMGQNPGDPGGMADGTTGEASLEELLGMTQSEENEETQNTDYLMQLMAGMLVHGTPQIAAYNGEEQTAAQLNSPTFAEVVASGANLPVWTTGLEPGPGPIEVNGKIYYPGVVEKSADGQTHQEILMEILAAGTGSTATAKSTETLAQNLFNSMSKPQGEIAVPTVNGEKAKLPIDMDALQQAVDSGKYLSQSLTAPKEIPSQANPQTLDILAQVKTGILANMQKGQSEFVIKLKPEGLGEITVKMTEVAGKVSMSIITQNQQTQNALSSEIHSLREALRPTGAEITQVITQQEANAQNFGEHRHGQQQQEQQRGGYQWQTDNQTTPAEQTQYVETLASALNSYV